MEEVKRRRSSIRKPRLQSENTDSAENPDITLAKARRVSFASSHAVKPFLDDPEKITIWDNTYEEEVNQDDSEPSKFIACCSTNENIEQSSETLHYVSKSKSCINAKGDIKTRSRKIVETIHDQENIVPLMDHHSILHEKSMDITEFSIRNQLCFNQSVNLEDVPLVDQHPILHEKSMDITEFSIRNQICLNQSISIADEDNVLGKSLKDGSNRTTQDDCGMEFTGVVLTDNYFRNAENVDKVLKSNISICNNLSVNDMSNMEFTCYEKSVHCIKNRNDASKTTMNSTRSDDADMEFTGVIQDIIKSNTETLPKPSEFKDINQLKSNTANERDQTLDITDPRNDMEFTGVVENIIKSGKEVPPGLFHSKSICQNETKNNVVDLTFKSTHVKDYMDFTGVIQHRIRSHEIAEPTPAPSHSKSHCQNYTKNNKIDEYMANTADVRDEMGFTGVIQDITKPDKIAEAPQEVFLPKSMDHNDTKSNVLESHPSMDVMKNTQMDLKNPVCLNAMSCTNVIEESSTTPLHVPDTEDVASTTELNAEHVANKAVSSAGNIKCLQTKSTVSTLQESKGANKNIKTNGMLSEQNDSSLQLKKVIYTEPLIIKQNDNLGLTDEIQSFDSSLQKLTAGLKTPQTYFHLSYSNMSVDNTQQLINAQVPKPTSFSSTSDLKQDFTFFDSNAGTKNILKETHLENNKIGMTFKIQHKMPQDNGKLESTFKEPLTESGKIGTTFTIQTQDNVSLSSNKIDGMASHFNNSQPTYDLTYTVPKKQIPLNQFVDPFLNLVENNCFIEDKTDEILNSTTDDAVDAKCKIKPNASVKDIKAKCSNTSNIVQNKYGTQESENQTQMENIDINNSDSTEDFKNYTLRAELKLRNISSLKLIKWEPTVKYKTELEQLIKKSDKLDIQLKEVAKTFNLIKVQTDNFEGRFFGNESKDTSSMISSSNSGIEENEIDIQSTDNKSQNESLFQHILEASKRNEDGWKLHSYKDNKYFFSTLWETIVLVVTVEAETGRVCDVSNMSTLSGVTSKLGKFLHDQFIQTIEKDRLKSVIGPKYDILSFLDYIYLTHSKLVSFINEFKSIKKDFGARKYIYNFTIKSDFSIFFEVFNLNESVYWKINIKISSIEQIQTEDVTLTIVYGKNIISQQDLQGIANSIPKGIDCLRTFVNNVYECILHKTRLRWKI